MTTSAALPPTLKWLESVNLYDVLEAKRTNNWLKVYLPEVAALHGVAQNPTYHPEVCTFVHIRLCLQAAEALGVSPAAKLAVLLHDLGKGITPAHVLPKHSGHEVAGLPLISSVCDRFCVTPYLRLLCLKVGEWHLHAHPGYISNPRTIFNFLVNSGLIDTSLPDEFVEDFVYACLSDNRGRLNSSKAPREYHDSLVRISKLFRSENVLSQLSMLGGSSPEYQHILRTKVQPRIELLLSGELT